MSGNTKDFKVKNGIQPTAYHEAVGTVSLAGGVATLDLSTGNVFELTPTSDIQVSLTNPAASGTSSGATLLLDGVGTTGYDLGNAFYDNKSFATTSQAAIPFGLNFNTDGTKMYILDDSVFQYTLSVAFDISTASYDSVSFDISSQDTLARGLSFNGDGTKMYILGTATDTVYQYSLSTAFDVSTLSYDNISESIAGQDTLPTGLAFKPDGTKMFVVGDSGNDINEYTFSDPTRVSTSSFRYAFSVASQDTSPYDVAFNADGTKMFVLGDATNSIYQYSLSTGFDLTTASYDSVAFSVIQSACTSLAFNSDGTKMYTVGNVGDLIHQYSTATPATITYDTSLQFSGGLAPTSPAIGDTDVLTFNTTDGGTSYKAVVAIDGAS